MVSIPFVKAHGARNDFLLTWRGALPPEVSDFSALAVALCHRHAGVGADGWILLSPSPFAAAAIELWNSDGSLSELSGNGARCAAALLVESGRAREQLAIATGAGIKSLTLLERRALSFVFEMNMGPVRIEESHSSIVVGHESVILNVGNPQCAVFVSGFDFDWRALGAKLERHPRFPNRTNVSFVHVIDRHTLDVRFFERGAGVTQSSGTGSAGAAAAALARGWVEDPVKVLTPAGPLNLRWRSGDILLAGPAEIAARGEFCWNAAE
ncbi:MAG TPA: diaminopimelate epimerase [Bryobacteraceae bacterium]|nr:diaminopimelate epimerase [Bryobacteraceae bacterium]